MCSALCGSHAGSDAGVLRSGRKMPTWHADDVPCAVEAAGPDTRARAACLAAMHNQMMQCSKGLEWSQLQPGVSSMFSPKSEL